MKTQQKMHEFMSAMQASQEKLQSRLDAEIRKRKSAERKAQRLDERLKYANSNRFGGKRQKVKKDSDKPDNLNRNKEKEEFDGTDDTLCTDSANQDKGNQDNKPEKKDRDLFNRPKKYNTMCVKGNPKEYHSDLTKVPGSILEKKMVKVFRLDMCLVEEHFVPCDNKIVKAANQGGELNAALCSNDLKEFFYCKRVYDEAGLTPEERLAERQSLETKEIVIRVRSRLDAELAKDLKFRSQYYTEALNYLKHFGDELFVFLDVEELPIDNN